MPNLLDLMTDEDRATIEKWSAKKTNSKYKRDVPVPFFVAAQLGYYYGWQAVLDFRRGYICGKDERGNFKAEAFTREEAIGLIKAAEKVHYLAKLEEARIQAANMVSSYDKTWAERNAEHVNRLADNFAG